MKETMKFKGRLRLYFLAPVLPAVVLLLLAVILAKDSRGVSALLFAVGFFYAAAEVFLLVKGRPALQEEIADYAVRYASAQKRLLNELEIPYAILDHNGRIVWGNARFRELTGISPDYRKSVTGLYPSITREILQKITETENIRIEKDGKTIRAYIRKIRFDDLTDQEGIPEMDRSAGFLTLLYLYDETELARANQRIAQQRMASALVYIDNYEEVMNSIEDVKQGLLAALVDRKVNQYFARMDGLVRKIEKDKYFVAFQYQYLDKMKEDRFHVLEEVKGIKVGNELSVTLSIGIGVGSDSYNEDYAMSRAAIDLALGRGGDQVVLKDGDEIRYYGGTGKQVESKKKVKARVKAQALQELICASENVLIMGHSLTDVDALGAGIGVFCAARAVGKKAQIVVNNPTSSVRPFLDLFSKENGYPEDLFVNSAQAQEMADDKTMIMVVDTNRPSYTECPQILTMSRTVVVFDHHRQGTEVVENPVLSYIEPYASSACELITEVLQYYNGGVRLNSMESDCMYAGILVDTNNFMTKTGVRTFEAAAYLKRSGADVTRVRKMLRNDMAAYKARAAAVRDAEVFRKAFAISICPGENIESPTIVCAQAANELLNIIGIKASFVLTVYNNKIYISSRSIDEINVQIIMERLGGGGHMNTAGAQLSGCTIEEAKKKLKDTIETMIKEGDITE